MKKKVYKKLYITQNTIVPRGAVQEAAVFKAEKGGELFTVQLKDPVYKVFKKEDGEPDRMHMSSIMFMLNKEDSQECIAKDRQVLEDAAVWFNKYGKKELKFTHKGGDIDADTMCIWIVQKGDPIFPDEKYIGALASTAKFNDREKWNLVKSEKWETSIEGKVEEVEEDEEVEKTLFEKLYNKLVKHFELKKAEGENMTPEEIKVYIDEKMKLVKEEILAELKPVEAEKKPEETPAEKEIKTLKEKIEALEKSAKKSVQTDEINKQEEYDFLI